MLVGWGLHDYCTTKNIQVAKPAYLILVGGDQSGDLRFEREIFFESLRPHTFYKESGEVVFNSGLVLNVANVYSDPEVIPVRLDKVFSYRHKRLRTAYLYWQDSEPILRILKPANIVGIGGRASKLHNVLHICGLTLAGPDGRDVQYLFETNGKQGRSVRPNRQTGSHRCAGWRYI